MLKSTQGLSFESCYTMKTLFAALAITLVYVSSLARADHPSNTIAAERTPTMSMTDKTHGQNTPELVVPVGVISNTIDAQDNDVLIRKSNIVISKSDRVKLAKTIKEMLSTSSETNPAIMMSADRLMDLLTRIAATPSMFSHAAGIISAARSGNTGDVADHVVGLLGAALRSDPASVDTPAPVVAPTEAPMPASADSPAGSD